jgi:hypothetical protein
VCSGRTIGPGYDDRGNLGKQGDDDRVGWRHGDKNYDHTGPKRLRRLSPS